MIKGKHPHFNFSPKFPCLKKDYDSIYGLQYFWNWYIFKYVTHKDM